MISCLEATMRLTPWSVYLMFKRVRQTCLAVIFVGVTIVAPCGSAELQPRQAYKLTVTVSGSGTVSSSPSGISCPGTCSASFASGTDVTLTATPASSGIFSGWTNGLCQSSPSLISSTCAFTVGAPASVTAIFDLALTGPTTLSPWGESPLPPIPTTLPSGLQTPNLCNPISSCYNDGIYQLPTWPDPLSGACAFRMSDVHLPIANTTKHQFVDAYKETNGGDINDRWWSQSLAQTSSSDIRFKIYEAAGGRRYLLALNINTQNCTVQAYRPYSTGPGSNLACPEGTCSAFNGWTYGAGGIEFAFSDPCRVNVLSNGTYFGYYEFGPDAIPASWGPTACAGNPNGPPMLQYLTNPNLPKPSVLSTQPPSNALNAQENLPTGCTGTACTGLPSDFGAQTWGNDCNFEGGDLFAYCAFSSAKYHWDGPDWCASTGYPGPSGGSQCTQQSGGIASLPSPVGRIFPLSASNNPLGCSFSYSQGTVNARGTNTVSWASGSRFDIQWTGSISIGPYTYTISSVTNRHTMVLAPSSFPFPSGKNLAYYGFSGSVEPTFSTSTVPVSPCRKGSIVVDGSIDWTNDNIHDDQDSGIYGIQVFSGMGGIYGVMSFNTASGQTNADPTVGGFVVTDNSTGAGVWTPWSASTVYTLLQPIMPPTSVNPGNCAYQVVVAGTSGTSQPNWTNAGSASSGCTASQILTDGSVTWSNTGLSCNLKTTYQTGQCTGQSYYGAAPPFYFTLHAGRPYISGHAVSMAQQYCISGECPSGPPVWVAGSTTVYGAYTDPSTGTPEAGSGHNNAASFGIWNNPDGPAHAFDYRTEALYIPNGAYSGAGHPPNPVNALPSCLQNTAHTLGSDQHQTGVSANLLDTNYSFFTYTSYAGGSNYGLAPFDLGYGAPVYACPWTGEIDAAINNPNYIYSGCTSSSSAGCKLVYREMWPYNSMWTKNSVAYYVDNTLFTCSVDMRFCSAGTDGYQSIRSVAGQGACVPHGPDWQANYHYPVGYYITPETNKSSQNPGGYSYIVISSTGAGTSGASEPPSWNQSPPSSVGAGDGGKTSDGSVVWQNVYYAPSYSPVNFSNACASEIVGWYLGPQ